MKGLKLICPECQNELMADTDKLYCSNSHKFDIDNSVYNLLPKGMSDTTKNDAIYHERQKETSVEQHQTDTFRNLFFRKRIAGFIAARCEERSNILEIGGGVGYDLKCFLEDSIAFSNYIFSEVSVGILSHVCKKINNNKVDYCCIDGHNIPFGENQFDFVYMIAAFHHLLDADKALKEIVRVTKGNGFVIFGIEPNRRLLQFLFKIKKPLVKMLPEKSHSPADQQADGFTADDFRKFEKRYNLRLMRLEPVWFLCGFIHYGLEFLYRLLRLKKRIRLPIFIEKILLYLDRLICVIPGAKNFCWNYTAIYQKNEYGS